MGGDGPVLDRNVAELLCIQGSAALVWRCAGFARGGVPSGEPSAPLMAYDHANSINQAVPQGLKPGDFLLSFAARLKPRPFKDRQSLARTIRRSIYAGAMMLGCAAGGALGRRHRGGGHGRRWGNGILGFREHGDLPL